MGALGFVQFSYRYLIRNQVANIAFYAGFQDGSDTGDEVVMESVLNSFHDTWVGNVVTAFSPSRLVDVFANDVTLLGGKILAKGGIGIQAIQRPLPSIGLGTRAPVIGSLLPPQNTVSCYAGRFLVLGRGAKVSFTGGYEGDWDSTQWVTVGGGFWGLVKGFVEGWDDFVAEAAGTVGENMYAAVVPRISYTAPSGKPATRLPYLPTDAAETFPIVSYDPSLQSGSNNKNKVPLR